MEDLVSEISKYKRVEKKYGDKTGKNREKTEKSRYKRIEKTKKIEQK